MYNKDRVHSIVASKYGFRQSFNVSDYEVYSNGSIIVNDEHPLCTSDNIYALRDFKNEVWPSWDASKTYSYADAVQIDDSGTIKYFKAKYNTTSNLNINPLTDVNKADFWKETNPLSNYMEDVLITSIENVIDDVINRKKINYHTKSLFDRVTLFEGAGRMNDLITKQDRFVGIEINSRNLKDLQLKINRIGLQFNTIQTDLPVYLFHSASDAPIATQLVTTTNPVTVNWIDSSFLLNQLDYITGTFYLGYFESDIAGQAIKKDYRDVKSPGCCYHSQYHSYLTYSKYAQFTPFYVPNSLLDGTNLWNIADNRYTEDNNYGINLDMSMNCDITNFILDNWQIFTLPIKETVCHNLIRAMAHNTLNSGLSEKVKQMALYELSPDNAMDSIVKRREEAIKGLSFDMSELNSLCIAGERKGVRYHVA